jgi:hypothetical protein
MGFTFGTRAGMSGVPRAFVNDIELNGRKGFGELLSNLIGYAHPLSIARAAPMSSVTFSCFFIF